MQENIGNGWVDRGPRVPVPIWDDDMRYTKRDTEISWRELGYSDDYSEESYP